MAHDLLDRVRGHPAFQEVRAAGFAKGMEGIHRHIRRPTEGLKPGKDIGNHRLAFPPGIGLGQDAAIPFVGNEDIGITDLGGGP